MIEICCQCDYGVGLQTPHLHRDPVLGWQGPQDNPTKVLWRWGVPDWDEPVFSVDWKAVARACWEAKP